MEIEVEYPILVMMPDNDTLAFLKEKGGERRLTVYINIVSFHQINWQLDKQKIPRPLVFNLLVDYITTLKSKIEKVVVYDATDEGFFHSYVVIRDEVTDRVHELPLHIPDAIALAVAAECPIFVVEEVFAKIKICREKKEKEIREEEIKKMFEDIDPDKSSKN